MIKTNKTINNLRRGEAMPRLYNYQKCLFVFLFAFVFSANISFAADITGIRHSASSDSVRIVLDISDQVSYDMTKTASGIEISLPNANIQKDDLERYKILDALINKVALKKTDDGSKLVIETSYPVEPKVFCLKNPFRIAIDFPRKESAFLPDGIIVQNIQVTEELTAINPSNSWFSKLDNIDSEEISMLSTPATLFKNAEKISNGLSLLKTTQTINDSSIKTYALSIDLKKMDVTPVISVSQIKKDGGSIFGALFNVFSSLFEEKAQKYAHFSKRTVSSFVKVMKAVAGINGSFFYGSGTPVGVLIVNQQIVSSPLYNRTALILHKDGKASIDSVKMEGYIKSDNGDIIGFSGVNQPISKDEIMVYTPDYQSTDPSSSSTNIIVVDDKVKDITNGETKIPVNGFVISANGVAGESIKSRFSKGGSAKWFFITTPPFNDMLHVIAGGPRLVYNGEPYVSSKEERFKNDVANSRAARTAVGITKNGNLLFVVVEKNQQGKGATLDELSKLMIKLGAIDAMNLDGGGSSTMIVNGATLNNGAGRPVSNALVIIPKQNL